MALIKTTINTNVVAGGMSFNPKQQEVWTDGMVSLSREIPANASNIEFTFAVPVLAAVKGFFLSCKKKTGDTAEAGALTVKTNSTDTPGNTYVIKQASGLAWDLDDPVALPIDAVITKLYVSNSGNAVMEFTAIASLDATPGVS